MVLVTGLVNYREPPVPAFLFDLDGTLIDSVYQNVIAWRNALATVDIDLSVWRIYRLIGMSGGLFIAALLRETGRTLTDAEPARSSVPLSVSYSITLRWPRTGATWLPLLCFWNPEPV